ncbi:MAG: hypothetical protein CMK92_02720 [Pseudomonas sp.]|nr:hypothetical protein [Pseudomonas sp.]
MTSHQRLRMMEDLSSTVHKWKTNENTELEVRVISNDGITREFFLNIKDFLDSVVQENDPRIGVTYRAEQTVNALYKHHNKTVRVRMFLDTKPEVRSIEELGVKNYYATDRAQSLAFSLKSETPCPFNHTNRDTLSVRQQIRYIYAFEGLEYHLTRYRQGRTADDARNSPHEQFAVEMELTDAMRSMSEADIATVLVSRGVQLLGNTLDGKPNEVHFS